MSKKRNFGSIAGRAAVGALALTTVAVGAGVDAAQADDAPVSYFNNGSFEQPDVTDGSFRAYTSGSVFGTCWTTPAHLAGPTIRCWRVTSGSVDVVDSGYWAAFSGRQSVDLNSNQGAGTIRQDTTVVSSSNFQLKFRAAMNPDAVGGTAPLNVRITQRDRTGRVLTTKNQPFSISSPGGTRRNPGFQEKTVPFTTLAGTTNVSVELSGGDSGSIPGWAGPVVDHAALYKV